MELSGHGVQIILVKNHDNASDGKKQTGETVKMK
jgi:hypothetical protein